MNDIIEVVGLLEKAFWPVFWIVLIFLFRREAKSAGGRLLHDHLPKLLDRLVKADIQGNVLEFSELQTGSVGQEPVLHLDESPDARWENVANIYWLGHDLMWVMDAIARGANKDNILQGLEQIRHHLASLRLASKELDKTIRSIIDTVTKYDTVEFGLSRKVLFRDVDKLSDMIGAILEAKQEDFEPYATGTRGGTTASERVHLNKRNNLR